MEREEQQQYASDIIRVSRDALILKHRFLARPLYYLTDQVIWDGYLATDGNSLFCDSEKVMAMYLKDKHAMEATLLHMMLHCLYGHPFFLSEHERRLWDLCTDIYVEMICLNYFERNAGDIPKAKEKRKLLEILNHHIRIRSAQALYRFMRKNVNTDNLFQISIEIWEDTFLADDHSIWYPKDSELSQKHTPQKQSVPSDGNDNDTGSASAISPGKGLESENIEGGLGSVTAASNDQNTVQKWQDYANRVSVELEASSAKQQGTDPADFIESLSRIEREEYSYERFLKQFATMEERMIVNPDEFDYVYYTYGLSLYKDTPLIEPLEYKEKETIREFAIAIDTSGSCDNNFIKRFLTKTYNILREQSVFCDEIEVHIIQCDAAVHSDAVLHNLQELENYIDKVEIVGRGGTDFRPVFDYITSLQNVGQLQRLRGLLYFTDGYGTFPVKPTPYKTAFVFAEVDDFVTVPPWAMKVYIEEESL